MSRLFVFIICAGMLVVSNYMKAGGHDIKVLQLNLWNGLSKVPGGYQGFVEMLDQIDPDVVLLCEINGGARVY